MLPIAGQTTGPNGLTLFVDTQWWPGGVKGKKEFEIFFSNNSFNVGPFS